MITATCTCGTRLEIPAQSLESQPRCPTCGACISIGGSIDAAAPVGDLAPLDRLQQLLGDGSERSGATPVPPVRPVQPVVPVGYAPERVTSTAARRYGVLPAIRGPVHGFGPDVISAFAYPAASSGNCINLATATFLAVVGVLAGQVDPVLDAWLARVADGGMPAMYGIWLLGHGIQFAVFGWLASLYMNVVIETASGGDDLPSATAKHGIMHNIVAPALIFGGALTFALAPALGYIGLVASDVLASSTLFLLLMVVYWFSVNWTIAVRGWLREGDRLRRTSLDLSLWCRS